MPDINITVAHKVAVSDTQSIVCDNSDYMVHWALDEEWSAYDTKTMRTIYMDGTFTDKVFSGAEVELPVCTVPGVVQIGLFAGDIRTSRVAILRALPSVRSAAGAPADPTPDVYDQLMERMAQLETSDWNQNDPTAKDYVRNRTHYVSRESRALVPEQEVTTTVQNNFNIATLNDVDSDALKTLYGSKDDTTFDVVFDGVSYPCKWLEQGGNRIPVFGNLAISNPDIPDTGEPFCVTLGPKDTFVIGCKVAGTHTVAVNYQQNVVHTLDPKYIKDMYYTETRKKYVSGYTGFHLATEGKGSFTVEKIRYHGVVYENVSGRQSMQYVYYDIGSMRVSVNMSTKTIYVDDDDVSETGIEFYTDVTTTHPVPDEYIPDWVASKSMALPIYYADATENGEYLNLNTLNVDIVYPCIVIAFVGQRTKSNILHIISGGSARGLTNCRTGKYLTSAETPYSVQVAFCLDESTLYGAVCLNPL